MIKLDQKEDKKENKKIKTILSEEALNFFENNKFIIQKI